MVFSRMGKKTHIMIPAMSSPTAVARRLMQARLEAGLTRAQVAERLGLHPNTVYKHETGRARLTDQIVERYARLYGRRLAWFYGDERPDDDLASVIARQQRELEELRRLLVERGDLQPVTELVEVKVLGTVPAGDPKEAIEQADESIAVPSDFLPRGVPPDRMYFLRVEGESMQEAGILEGSYVLVCPDLEVRDGDIAVVMTEDGEATIKKVYFKADGLLLMPCNGSMPPRVVKRARILGRVKGCWHKY